jgi:hypothetical protein
MVRSGMNTEIEEGKVIKIRSHDPLTEIATIGSDMGSCSNQFFLMGGGGV